VNGQPEPGVKGVESLEGQAVSERDGAQQKLTKVNSELAELEGLMDQTTDGDEGSDADDDTQPEEEDDDASAYSVLTFESEQFEDVNKAEKRVGSDEWVEPVF